MITNHSYLDNPTFRGMRRSLMHTFDDIHILDLHGNALKKERCPDGSPDQNVFDIRQGVSIAFFVLRGGKKESDARVWHAELYGTRESKYDWLLTHDHGNTGWRKLNPTAPFYLFVLRDEALAAGYQRFIPVPDVFPVNSVGIVTARDHLTIRWSKQEVWETVRPFSEMDPELARQGYTLAKDTRDWKVTLAQKDLRDSRLKQEKIVPILYRPFDVRYTYYTGRSRGFICMPRPEVMRHMLAGENLGFMMPKQQKDEFGALVTQFISAHKSVAAYDINYHFPLYLYPSAVPDDLFAHHESAERKPNLSPELVTALAKAHGISPSPEAIFHYVYAVLHAPAYRHKYAQFLRTDFPRIPFTADKNLFDRLAGLGSRLVALHLLESPELDPPACHFVGEGNDTVVARTKAQGFRYDPAEQRMHVNRTKYFGPLSPEVYEYRIGGYQVCEKWLKDRKERRLLTPDIQTYCRMVTAIERTITIQQQLDGLYPNVEQNILQVAC